MRYKFYLLNRILITVFLLSFAIHLPRIYIDHKQLLLKDNLSNGEDKYHKDINLRKKSSRIISWTSYKLSDSDWDIHIKNFTTKVIKLVKDNINSMQEVNEKNIVYKKKKNEVKSYKIENDKPICIWINKKIKTIRTVFDHEYCGGYFFIQYAALLSNGEPAALPTVPIKIPFMVETELLKLLYKKPYEPKYEKYKLVSECDKINRLTFSLNTDDKITGISTRVWILWKIVTYIMKVDKNREGLDIMMPIAFNKLEHIYNNIGVIFIKYKRGDTIETLSKEVEEKRGMLLASNYYLRTSHIGASQGKKLRNNVDIVFTSAYVKNSNVSYIKHVTTYNQIADYAIYCFTATVNKNISVTLTLNTQELSVKNLLEEIPDSKPI